MRCPKCKVEMSNLQRVNFISDGTNRYGRRQLTFQALHKENIHWNGKEYECSNCGYVFSFQEGVLQK